MGKIYEYLFDLLYDEAILISTHIIHFYVKIGKILRISLNVCFLELSEEFSRDSIGQFVLTVWSIRTHSGQFVITLVNSYSRFLFFFFFFFFFGQFVLILGPLFLDIRIGEC